MIWHGRGNGLESWRVCGRLLDCQNRIHDPYRLASQFLQAHA